MSDTLIKKAQGYLTKLCLDIPERYLGSSGNRKATEFFSDRISACGFDTEADQLQCMDWKEEGSTLSCHGKTFAVYTGPYSVSCSARLPLNAVKNMAGLEKADLKQRIVLLYGEIAKEQLMPKNISFYNPEHHQRIIALLEQKNPDSVGGLYPFPLIEDGDFNIPSVYMTEEEGRKLLGCVGQDVSVEIKTERIPAVGYNVVGAKGKNSEQKIVLCEHIDSRRGSPGALDNAGGVAVFMLLAELLHEYRGAIRIELAALNGHEYYSAPGAVSYLGKNKHAIPHIILAVNLDGVGYKSGNTAFSFYECPEQIIRSVEKVFAGCKEFVKGEPWPQSDHMIFAMSGRPAIALTSDFIINYANDITPTDKDRPEIIDCEKLVNAARVLYELIQEPEIDLK